LSEKTGHSLGVINRSIKNLTDQGYLDCQLRPTAKAKREIKDSSPSNAVILAAGFGMRMVPINLSTPKALIEVRGQRLIERLISQLHEAGVTDITVVVGFMKESFEYLIDKYDVDLVVNSDYASKNNLHSLNLVRDLISNTYIIPCDVWCDINPFSKTELYSWYMVSDRLKEESCVRVNRKTELVSVPAHDSGNAMIGISYLTGDDAETVKSNLTALDNEDHADDF
jgi:CTP:phosphocholine cytidylyltransferase-like protein